MNRTLARATLAVALEVKSHSWRSFTNPEGCNMHFMQKYEAQPLIMEEFQFILLMYHE